MPKSKTLNTRIVNKHETEEHWLAAVNFIPLEGEVIVYDPDETHPQARMKIGDGQTNVNALPFAADPIGAQKYVDDKVAELNSTVIKREIVEELPAIENASTNTIYMVPDDSSIENNNIYLEYILITLKAKQFGGMVYTGPDNLYGTTVSGDIAHISSSAGDMGDYFTFAVYTDTTHSTAITLYLESPCWSDIYNNFNVGDNIEIVFDDTIKMITKIGHISDIKHFELIGSSQCDLSQYQKKFGNVSGTTVTSTGTTLTFKNSSANAEISIPSSGTARIKANSALQLYAPSITLRNYSGSSQIAIDNVKTPTSTYQAANKSYVDSKANSTLNSANTSITQVRTELNNKINALDSDAAATGQAIRLDDVNNIPHELKLSIPKNLLKFPYSSTSATQSGITATAQEDGSILINGTGTAHGSFPLTIYEQAQSSEPWVLEPGQYLLSYEYEGNTTNTNLGNYLYISLQGITPSNNYQYLYPNTPYTLTEPTTIQYCYVVIYPGDYSSTYFSYDNFKVKVQLVEGDTPIEWYPMNTEPENNLSVSVYGKNLLPNTYADTSSTSYTGIQFTFNEDGSITANGSNPDYGCYYWLVPQNSMTLPAGTYTFSSGLTDGNTSTYYVGFKYGDKEIYNRTGPDTITLTETTQCGVCFAIAKGQTLNNLTIYPQLELGSYTITTYEKPVGEQISDDLTGLYSVYPTTSIIVNTAGKSVKCEYHKQVEGSTDNIIKEYVDNKLSKSTTLWENF